MRIVGLKIFKTGTLYENLLSVTIFMVFINLTEISAPSTFSNSNDTTVLLPKPTETKRPWPSHDFLRNIIHGTFKNMSDYNISSFNSNIEKNASNPNIIIDQIKDTHMINTDTNTKRALNTPSISLGFPLKISALAARRESDQIYSGNEPVKYIKISGKHVNLDNNGNHWQTLNNTGIIVAKREKEQTHGFGWASSGEQNFPPGFSKLTWPYLKGTTPFTPTNTYENYGTTGRPAYIFSTIPGSAYKWHHQNVPEVSRRPSAIIVKDGISSLHWGSSGSTLPPPGFQYSLSTAGNVIPSTSNSFQDNFASPYKQYGGHSIIGNTISTKTPTSIWYKPTLHHYTTTTVAPVVLTVKPHQHLLDDSNQNHNKNIMFKIWSYLDDGRLKLHGEKEIPAFLLNGHTIKDGDILNVEHIPSPIKQLVSSSLNHQDFNSWDKTSVITEGTQWQQLPILVPGGSTGGWGAPPLKEKPVSLNYVIWGSSTTPSPVTLLPPPDDYQKYLQDYLNKMTTPTFSPPKQDSSIDTWLLLQNYFQSQQMATRTPIIQGQNPLKVQDMNDFANNAAMLQLILSHLSKQQGNRDTPDSPKTPPSTNEMTRLKPPHRDSFWSSLYPIYQHLLTKRIKLPSIIRDDDQQSTSLAGFQNGEGLDTLSSLLQLGNSYSQSQNQQQQQDYPIISITESPLNSAESLTKTLVPKTERRKRRRRKKKCKRLKHYYPGYGLTNLLHPDKFDINYAFGINFYDILKKKFYALLALKLAPVIIITIAAVLPLAFLLWPQVFKLFSKHGKTEHHLHNPFHNHHKHSDHHHHPQNPLYNPAEHYPNLQQTYQNYPVQQQEYDPHQQQHYSQYYQQQPNFFNDQFAVGDNTGHIENKRITFPDSGQHNIQQYPASQIASLVDQKFGNQNNVRDFTGREKSFTSSSASKNIYTGYSDSELDTEYNRRVMEILMKNQNLNTRNRNYNLNSNHRSITSNSSHGGNINKNRVRESQQKIKRLNNNRVIQIPSSI